MKVGDKVLVRKPVNLEEGPGWCSDMDKYDGTIQEVSDVFKNRIKIKSDALCFYLSKWLTPVIDYKGKYYRTADEKGDIGEQVHVSDFSEIAALNNSFDLPLTEIKLDEFPFTAGGEIWKYALVEVKEKPADKLEKALESGGILCETYEEKYALLSYLEDQGYKWNSGSKVHEYNWRRLYPYGNLEANDERLMQGGKRENQTLFSTFSLYAEIMERYAPAVDETTADTPAETPVETPKEPEMFVHEGKKYRLATEDDIGKEAWFTDYGIHDTCKLTLKAINEGVFVSGACRWKYAFVEIPQKEKESSKSEEMLGSDVIPTTVNWDVPFNKEFMTVTYNPAMEYEKSEETPLTKEETGIKSLVKSRFYDGLQCWSLGGQGVVLDPSKFSYIDDEKSSESEKKMTKPSIFTIGTVIRGSQSCPLKVIVDYLSSKGYRITFSDLAENDVIEIEQFRFASVSRGKSNEGRYIAEFAEYADIINFAASAAKPQKESKMALFSLASKKVRGLAYGALDWAFVSPLKRTFKPVATIAQFSVCYLTLAAAGYFAYGLYQNPQSVVEWISEISPLEIRLKNTEE